MNISARDKKLTRIVRNHGLSFTPGIIGDIQKVFVRQNGELLGAIAVYTDTNIIAEDMRDYPEALEPVIQYIRDCLLQYHDAYAGCFDVQDGDRKLYVLYEAERPLKPQKSGATSA